MSGGPCGAEAHTHFGALAARLKSRPFKEKPAVFLVRHCLAPVINLRAWYTVPMQIWVPMPLALGILGGTPRPPHRSMQRITPSRRTMEKSASIPVTPPAGVFLFEDKPMTNAAISIREFNRPGSHPPNTSQEKALLRGHTVNEPNRRRQPSCFQHLGNLQNRAHHSFTVEMGAHCEMGCESTTSKRFLS